MSDNLLTTRSENTEDGLSWLERYVHIAIESQYKEVIASLWKYIKNVPDFYVDLQIPKLNRCFLQQTKDEDYFNVIASPSITRFYGVLLFIDISGFTDLSTKLSVQELRFHINSYFEKILKIIEKYEGQVVKFAGDALYVVWPVDVQNKVTGKSTISLCFLCIKLVLMYLNVF